MITRKGGMLALSLSRRFFYDFRVNPRKRAGFSIDNGNLQSKSQLFVESFNSRYMSAANLAVSETDLRKFVNKLIKAHYEGKNTEFDRFLNFKPISVLMNERHKLIENLSSLEELEEDKEMVKLVQEEKSMYENRLTEIDTALIDLILKNLTVISYDDLIMEISAGVGGQEAMLFAKDLLELYTNHLTHLGYKFNVIELEEAMQGGIKSASIMISGDRAFEKLRHEAGNHRVQRIPVTEKSGRMHTSIVSVAVLPQPSEIEVKINPKDLRIDTMRATGAGGQHVNKTDSAVRITHYPSGISVECQEDRSQIKNRETAMTKLRTKLYQIQLDKQMKSASSMRKQQMGLGLRNEKIRTYNFNQDRVTDHRISNGTVHNINGFMEGGMALDNLHSKLNEDLHQKILVEIVNSVK